MKKNTGMDIILIGMSMVIGLAEAAHLAAMVLGWSFSRCALLFVVAAVGVVCILGGIYGYGKVTGRQAAGANELSGKKAGKNRITYILCGVFVLVVLSQMVFIGLGEGIYRQGDMTVETVRSFLAEDAVYAVNPMTGRPYTGGLPMRLQILCLPSLYGFVCDVTGVSPLLLVQTIVPIVVLFCTYVAFAALGKVLFAEDGTKRACFLLLVSLLLWVGAYAYGLDGFNVLCCGWRGVTIRNAVVLPWLFSLVLRKKWICALLCILAEACIVWTLYGMGVGVLVVVGMLLFGACYGKCIKDKGNDRSGKEEAK